MNEHLALKVRGKYANLPEDFSIDIEDVNPIFNDYESFSFDAPLPIESNKHILKDLANVKSDKRLVDLENESIQVIAEGIPFRTGRLQTTEGEVINDSITFSMVSAARTLQDLVADLQCRDIPVKDRIQIGEMIGNVLVEATYQYRIHIKATADKKDSFERWTKYKNSSIRNTFELQALGFSYPGICDLSGGGVENAVNKGGRPSVSQNFINVSEEYPAKPYCNGRVCYTHYLKEDDGTSGKTVSTKEKFDPYYILEADRPQSGICFYLLYILDCLFHYLGFIYDNKELLKIGDMKRLCFFTTHCKYDLERKYPEKGIVGEDDVVVYDFSSIEQINAWLSSRTTKGQLKIDYDTKKELSSATVGDDYYEVGKPIESGLGEGMTVEYAQFENQNFNSSVKANIMNMYANSENFPDLSVSGLLDSLWGSFGIRFMVDYERSIVKPIFIREVFRDTSSPILLRAKLLSVHKLSEKITGFRMKYSSESDPEEQQKNIRYGVKDYDTDYDYIDYSRVNSSLDYLNIIKRNGSSDKTCYIDLNTGNAYRIKVDKDATTISELKPAIFEVGGYKGVDLGDCSKINEDFIIELESEFQPLILNDVNGRYEKNVGEQSEEEYELEDGTLVRAGNFNASERKQILAAFVDEDMWHEGIEFKIQNVMGNNTINAYLTEVCTTDENYDPSETEDGNSPLQHYDWGAAITMMRGGGSDAEIQHYDYNYDGCGNSKWRIVAGEYSMSTDSIDNWGTVFDYNGTIEGVGEDERFSLKVRAFKVVNGEILCNNDIYDDDGNIETKVRSRGLFDTFMSEYAHFTLNRKKLEMQFYCNISDLLNIQWDKRYKIDDYIFWWNKLSYSVSVQKGLGIVTAEVYML